MNSQSHLYQLLLCAFVFFGLSQFGLGEKESGGNAGEEEQFFIKQSWSQEKDFRRPYLVNFPKRDEGGKAAPFPVVIFLHGNGGNAKGQQRMVFGRYPDICREFITVFPEGYQKS